MKKREILCTNCGWSLLSHAHAGGHDGRIALEVFKTPKNGYEYSLDDCPGYEPTPPKINKVKGINIPPRGSHLAAVERPVVKR